MKKHKQPEYTFVPKRMYDLLEELTKDKVWFIGPIYINWSAIKRKLRTSK